MEKQTFENYQDYLNSEKWKQVKEEFDSKYLSSGWTDVCEVTGESFANLSQLHHHHFKYPKDWNDDSPKNIVFISKDLHSMIHGKSVDDEQIDSIVEECPHNPNGDDLMDRDKYLSYLRNWNISILMEINCSSSIQFDKTSEELWKLKEEHKNILSRFEDEMKRVRIIVDFLLNEVAKRG